jgi:hypothetical protein
MTQKVIVFGDIHGDYEYYDKVASHSGSRKGIALQLVGTNQS